MNILEALLLLVLLIVISAFVSCSELALASARKIKLQVMAKDGGDTRALDVLNMQQQPGSFITVVQIGLNAVAILAGIVGEAAVRPYFGGLLANAGKLGQYGRVAADVRAGHGQLHPDCRPDAQTHSDDPSRSGGGTHRAANDVFDFYPKAFRLDI